ncbi:NADP-dependent phosphogluconate dehydrogenase [Streptomyces sp. NPDC056580]|uniref:NADP-dependent phosphogluconate dehydrogenase n=1 Tax=Streptomyces sp. NPDC056580 TaxID=3345872 RepID=UPI0036811474
MNTPDGGGPPADVAVVGLGVMGANLARNLARHGHRVAVHDRLPAKGAALLGRHGHEGRLLLTGTVGELAARLTRPRRVLLLVPAGAATDAAIDALTDVLEPGDVLVDCGNAHADDTERRAAALRSRGLHLVGAGVSGGEEGALRGPSIMAGGTEQAWEVVRPLLESVAARAGAAVCCARVGPGGAGHFAKTVHNGIEYAVMQALAETCDLVLRRTDRGHAGLAELLARWNEGLLESYLVALTAAAVARVDPVTGAPFLDVVDDGADQLGTGRWAAQAALDLGVPAAPLTQAVFARSLSRDRKGRAAVRGALGPLRVTRARSGAEPAEADLHDALLAATAVAYAQGLDVVRAADAARGRATDLVRLTGLWRAGCVIRGRLLDQIADTLAARPDTPHLLAAEPLAPILRTGTAALRRVVLDAFATGVPVPALASVLTHLDQLRTTRMATAVVQAQRDAMGAHAYRRVDRSGTYHTRWNGDGAEIRLDA